MPGESRGYLTIADAIEGLGTDSAYGEFMRLIQQRSFTMLWCRSLDRLARTSSMIAEIQGRCRQINAVVWSEQMPPSGQVTGDLFLSAIESANAQREIHELVRRTHYGMNARARQGKPMSSTLPYGYLVEYVGGERVAVVDETAAAIIRWVVEQTLSGVTQMEIVHQLRRIAPERDWEQSGLVYMLRNPFYIGMVRRTARGTDGRRVEIVSEGRHEAILDAETFAALQSYLDMRKRSLRPPGRLLWSGILHCGFCNAMMYTDRRSQSYHCGQHHRYRDRCAPNYISQAAVTEMVVEHLHALYQKHRSDVEAGLIDTAPPQSAALTAIRLRLDDLAARRLRLVELYETGRVDIATYDQRARILAAESNDLQASLTDAQREADMYNNKRETIASLEAILPTLRQRLLADPNQAEANRWLRGIFSRILVKDGQVTSVTVAEN